MRSVVKKARTREEAIHAALREMGVERHEVAVEILDEGSSGILGLFRRDVAVRVTAEGLPDEPIHEPSEVREAREPRGRGRGDRDRSGRDRRPREERATRPPQQEPKPQQPQGRQRDSQNRDGRLAPEVKEAKPAQEPRPPKPAREGKDEQGQARGPRAPRESRQRDRATAPAGQERQPAPQRPAATERPDRPERTPRPEGGGRRGRRGAPPVDREPKVLPEGVEQQAVERPITTPRAPRFTPKPLELIGNGDITPGSNLLEELIAHMGIQSTVRSYSTSDGDTLLRIESPDSAMLIGRKGHTLQALQYLINRMIRHEDDVEDTERIIVDVEGYVDRRREALQGMAMRMADRVRESGRQLRVKPLSPQERRIIHLTLQDDPDLKTFSVGDAPVRCVVIAPKSDQGLVDPIDVSDEEGGSPETQERSASRRGRNNNRRPRSRNGGGRRPDDVREGRNIEERDGKPAASEPRPSRRNEGRNEGRDGRPTGDAREGRRIEDRDGEQPSTDVAFQPPAPVFEAPAAFTEPAPSDDRE